MKAETEKEGRSFTGDEMKLLNKVSCYYLKSEMFQLEMLLFFASIVQGIISFPRHLSNGAEKNNIT
ncbi:hypothetical protein SAMN04488134_102143 [Amphibacillus marinus]|uniref:Uncharacterized protein n=1 Tax=Amphibacillus marinus TaxID=872970 RepID=A0A1H8K2X7_9BACI|nr:hypothetical protein [Amphibacillus marinus]SEN86916.1 hypothetical protein SAMN04488134_102143 [Amphibacillus marinus]